MFYDFLHNKRIRVIGLVMALAGSVAGCGASSDEIPEEIATLSGLSSDTEFDYEVPQQIPGILVDQIGYNTDSDKAVVFKGQDLPETFDIYDLESGRPVYTGNILKSVYNEELGEYDSLAYFTDFTAEGDYYIYSDVLGESYSFSVKKDVYKDIMDLACKNYYLNRCGIGLSEAYAGDNAHSACHTTMARLKDDSGEQIDVTGGWHMDEQAGRDTTIGSRVCENLLLAYEMNPSSFGDDAGIPESGNNIPDILDEVRFEVEWLLKMQDTRTGGEYAAAVTDAGSSDDIFTAPVYVTPVSMDSTISFAAMMARFSYFYQEYDAEFATTCLKAADRAWSCYLNNRNAEDDSAAFNAAAQLYRATGDSSYHEILDYYFEKDNFSELFNTDENIFLGSVTYLSINQEVDVDRCTALMKLLMKRAEDIAARSSASTYLVSDYGLDEGYYKMLIDMRCLTVTDHIIYNHEYTTIIQNHVHYLAGMNPEAINNLTDNTERTYESASRSGIMNDPETDALLIFMLGVLKK